MIIGGCYIAGFPVEYVRCSRCLRGGDKILVRRARAAAAGLRSSSQLELVGV